MKNLNLIFVFSVISFSFSLFSMEPNNNNNNSVVHVKNERKNIKHPKRDDKVDDSLGMFAQLPTDIIIEIIFQLIEDKDITKNEKLKSLARLKQVNKFFLNLIEDQKDRNQESELILIQKRIASNYIEILNEAKNILTFNNPEIFDTHIPKMAMISELQQGFNIDNLKKFAETNNIQFIKNLINKKSSYEDLKNKINLEIDKYNNIANPLPNLRKKIRRAFKNYNKEDFDRLKELVKKAYKEDDDNNKNKDGKSEQ